MNILLFERFTDYLNERLTKRLHTTEDSVRYSFFAALMLSEGVSPSDVVQEYPHNAIVSAAVDTYIPHYVEGEAVLEIKYHRAIPSGKNSPRPRKGGQLFNDVYRLIQFNSTGNCLRMLVYLTDNEMASYMLNPNNNLMEFFTLSQGNTMRIESSFFSNKSATYQKSFWGCFSSRNNECLEENTCR